MRRAGLTRLARDERGFTLVELLAAITIGVIVILAAFATLDTAATTTHQTTQRMDGLQRGRLAMEDMTRQLRAQICLGEGYAPMLVAEDGNVEFYASLAPAPSTADPGITPPLSYQKRRLRYEATSPGRGRIVETVVNGSGSPPDVVFPADTAGPPDVTTRVLVDGIAPSAGVPLFRYYAYESASAPDMRLLATPVTAAERALTVKVAIAFDAFPHRGGDARVQTRLESHAFVRLADPTDPEHSPKCI